MPSRRERQAKKARKSTQDRQPRKPTRKQKRGKEEREQQRIVLFGVILISAIVLFGIFVMPLYKEYDFYEYHVWQIEQAHLEGKTFSLATGQQIEALQIHTANDWNVHPSEDPENVVHHGCMGNPQSFMVFGFYGQWIANNTVTYENIGDLVDLVGK